MDGRSSWMENRGHPLIFILGKTERKWGARIPKPWVSRISSSIPKPTSGIPQDFVASKLWVSRIFQDFDGCPEFIIILKLWVSRIYFQWVSGIFCLQTGRDSGIADIDRSFPGMI